MRLRFSFSFMTVAALLGGCATTAPRDWASVAAANPVPVVTAAGETVAVATAAADAADDPAIWRNPADPLRSLIVGTDKKAGLHVYALDGTERGYAAAGRVNNVDLIETAIADTPGILVAASDRNDILAAKTVLYRLDPATGALAALGSVAAGVGEAYGMCLGKRGDAVDAFVVMKDGTIAQIALDLTGASPVGRVVRTMKLATQSEGCVVDSRTGRLYVGEEDVGVWRFDTDPAAPITAMPVAKIDGRMLVADVEGVTLVPRGDRGGWLIVSSQGDNAYAVFDLESERAIGRFRIGAGQFGATSETDGIAAAAGDFGPAFPGGLFVAQDGNNLPRAQNFKLVAWDAILAALVEPAPQP